MNKNKKNKGFTLVEMVVSIIVLMIVGTVLLRGFSTAFQTVFVFQAEQTILVEEETHARIALLAIVRDARRSVDASVAETSPGSGLYELQFVTTDGVTITYSFNGDFLARNVSSPDIYDFIPPSLSHFHPNIIEDDDRYILYITIETERWLELNTSISLQRVPER